MNSDKFKRQIESMWKYRDTDEQKRLVKFTIAKTMRLALEYPELAQEYFDSLCKVIPDNERIIVSNYQHNLTSDGKGEEILMVPRSAVIAEMDKLHKYSYQIPDLQLGLNALTALFGTKCLPNEELKPTEPKENANKHFDNILKGSFMEHNRLHIAAMIMSGLLVSGKEKHPVRRALDLADALIAECEEGGDNA